MNKPKISVIDIETFPNIGYTWQKYEQNLLAYKQHGYMLSFAAKDLEDSRVTVRALPDYKGYKPGSADDKALVKDLWTWFDESDVIIAHNGNAFDVKKSYSAFLKHGLPPPRPTKFVDTKLVAKRVMRQDSNSLADLALFFGLGSKLRTGGIDLWLDVEKGIGAAWKKMRQYNAHDVILLEMVYKKMLPYMNNHPNYNLLTGEELTCPNCGSHHVQRRGYQTTRVTRSARFQCNDCGAWSSKPMDKNERRMEPRGILR
jgi:predicted RNA-binding Zn-ribbon protein involved in translation (DUF1610 family)